MKRKLLLLWAHWTCCTSGKNCRIICENGRQEQKCARKDKRITSAVTLVMASGHVGDNLRTIQAPQHRQLYFDLDDRPSIF